MTEREGLRVAIVKSAGRADAFADAVRAAGLVPVLVSPYRVEAIEVGVVAFRETLRSADEHRGPADPTLWIAVTSPHAVVAFEGLGDARRLVAGAAVSAVGQGTASALHALGVVPTVVGDAGGQALAERMIVAGLRKGALVVHPCGEEVRGELGDTLNAAGARVLALPVYRMIEDEIGARAATGSFAAVVIASPRLAHRAADLFPSRPPAVAIGRTTAAALRDIGWPASAVAAQPSPPDILAAIKAALARSG